MLHSPAERTAVLNLAMCVNAPAQSKNSSDAPAAQARKSLLLLALCAYVMLALAAFISGNGVLCAICAAVLVTVLFARPLSKGRIRAWLIWLGLLGTIGWLTSRGQGKLALDVLPIFINLALAWLFGHTLLSGRTPLIARAIIAIDGRERLALPRVASYARVLTIAWTALFLLQACLFVMLLAWLLPQGLLGDKARSIAQAYVQFGGYLVPVAFMLLEYAFRRLYLRDIPHASVVQFGQRLAQNWHGVLNDDQAVKRSP
jgi:uncharacterized membrane protein